MKIVLTGADGMLGHALNDVLFSEELFAFNKEELDITDAAMVEACLEGIKPDFVVNGAGYTNVDGAEDNPELAFKINAEALEHLSQACNKVGATLIHFSTDYVFDGEKKEGYSESDPKNPINVYGRSKAQSEDIIEKTCNKYAIIRTSWLFGPYGKNFVDTMLKLAKELPELKVVNDQIGSPTYTYDLAKAVYEVMQKNMTGIFHLTNEGVLSWYEFALMIFEMSGQKVELSPIATTELTRKAKRPHYSILLNTKLPHLPGIKEALKSYLS